MLDIFQTSRFQTAIWAVKMLLVMVGTVSTVTLLKAAIVPFVVDLTVSTVPQLWISFRSCLSPLYIYILLNFIIITIVASSFQNPNQKKKKIIFDSSSSTSKTEKSLAQLEQNKVLNEQIVWNSFHIPEEKEQEKEEEEEEEHSVFTEEPEPISIDPPADPVVISNSAGDPLPETGIGENPLKDSGKIQSENRSTEEEFDDTLEATWKAITDKQSEPKGRRLKKSETWDVPPTPAVVVGSKSEVESPAAWARRELKKSETFADRVTMIRDKSMSQEELYQRAEEFIKKFNHDMKLQRQESDQRFMDMVNRGL